MLIWDIKVHTRSHAIFLHSISVCKALTLESSFTSNSLSQMTENTLLGENYLQAGVGRIRFNLPTFSIPPPSRFLISRAPILLPSMARWSFNTNIFLLSFSVMHGGPVQKLPLLFNLIWKAHLHTLVTYEHDHDLLTFFLYT